MPGFRNFFRSDRLSTAWRARLAIVEVVRTTGRAAGVPVGTDGVRAEKILEKTPT